MKTIEQYIETEISGKISRKRNSPLPALMVLAVGICLLVLLRTTTLGDSLGTACLTVGIICIALGFVLTAMNLSGAMTHFVYLPTRSRMKEKKVYVSGDDYKDIADAIMSGNLQPLATIRPVVSSNSAVRILASCDGECVLIQAIRDQSGHFEPETEVRVLTSTAAAAIQHLMK
jgi:hypothetical protein